MTRQEISFTPAQQRAASRLLEAIPIGSVFALEGEAGSGKTLILGEIHRACGGVLLGMREFIASLQTHAPAAIEEAFVNMMEQAMADHELILVDDLHLLVNIVESCDYPRSHLFTAALTAVLAQATSLERKLGFAVEDQVPSPIQQRAYTCKIDDFESADFESICRVHLGAELASRLNFGEIHRFAPKLSCHQLRKVCTWLQRRSDLNTEGFIDYLHAQHMISNVDLDEVQAVDWNDLKGVDEVIQSLEAKVAFPFENGALAAALGLKPKRGVLLAGPPGTGKTTIGRALAHRLKSKFFLIDGTVVAGSDSFYRRVFHVFEEAKRNAPAVVFIDDADVIFEDKDEHGFYRYLLTMLDGLESASAERVCVIMTAMDVNSLPPAMVRSGRIELWLETKLPDETARAVILREKLAKLPSPIGSADIATLANASRGMTGADLKAVVEDAKLLYAQDVVLNAPSRPAEEYYLEAIATVRANGRRRGRRTSVRPVGTTPFGFGMEEFDVV
jgi:tRNA A37 threonylcarbamoyladenosine biosynthesis protein TsaE